MMRHTVEKKTPLPGVTRLTIVDAEGHVVSRIGVIDDGDGVAVSIQSNIGTLSITPLHANAVQITMKEFT